MATTTTATSKVVLVTGCTKGGIGFALCKEYAYQGCLVYATARKLEAMDDLTHSNIKKLVLDVTDDDDVQKAVQTIIDNEGRVDILVNNAGANCAGAFLDIPLETVKSTFDTNTFSILRMSKAVFPHMADRKSGVIVNMGSVGGDIPTPWNGAYSASKAAVRGISDVLWMEFKPFNITCMHVTAGAVKSNIARKVIDSGVIVPPDSRYKAFARQIVQRVWASQSPNAMPAEEFAQKVVGASVSAHPPRYMTLGGYSGTFWMLSWFPRAWALGYMWWKFKRERSG